VLGESDFGGDLFCPGLVSDGGAYPSHLRPVEVHLLQKGFSSPHLTRRILQNVSSLKRVQFERALLWYVLAGDAACPDRSATYPVSVGRLGLHDEEDWIR
jgi:hypothetical protein